MRLHLSITAKLVGYLLVAGIVPLLAFGISAFQIAREVVLEQASAYNLRVVADMATYLELYRDQVEDLASNVASNETIAQAMGDADGLASSAYDTLNTRAQIGYILSNLGRVKGLVSIDLLTLGGQHFYIGETLDVSVVPLDTVRGMVAASEAVGANALWRGVEDNINTTSTQKKVITLSRVVRRYDPQSGVNSTVGVVLISLNDAVFRDYFRAVALPGGVRMMVVDRNGRLMFHSDRRLLGKMLEPELLQLVRSPLPMQRLLLDKVEVVMTSVAVQPGGSHLVFATPLAQLTNPVDRIAGAGLLLLLVCLAGIGLLALHYSRTVVRPLRAVSERFQYLRDNPSLMHLPLVVSSQRDEITTLVEGFNSHIETLTAQRQAEAARKRAEQAALESLYQRQREAVALREIEAKNLQLEESNRMKSEFLANMSHELRTPLNAIIGFSEVLKDGLLGKLLVQQQDYVTDIFNNGSHLLSLINDILDLSKVEAGKMALTLAPLPLAPLFQAGLQVVRANAAAHHIALSLELSPDLQARGEIWLDERKTKQIIFNLLSNGVKFTPDGGAVQMVVRCVPGATVDNSHWNNYLEIVVRDTGIGISEQDKARLFQPFTQIDSTLARGYEGTGLGLVMVRRLAELQGGSVALDSVQGQGSTFTVLLPWRHSADSAPRAGMMPAGGNGERDEATVVVEPSATHNELESER
jgi:signal transduction histidine kinase